MSPTQGADGSGGMPAAEALTLNEMVDYQEGSIVSRTLAKTKGGTVTLFAFDEGQALSEHTAPFDALVNVIDGEVEVSVEGKPIPTHAGESVMMPANIPHALTATKRFKMLLVMVRPD